MGDDVERIIVSNQRTEVQSCHVLNTVFLADAIGQFLVGTHLITQGFDLGDEFRMTLTESLLAGFVTCIKDSTIGKDNPCRDHHTIAIGMNTAVHTRGIVDDDTTYHRTSYRGRIRWEHSAIRLQNLIHPSTYDARLEFNTILILADFVLLPMLTCHDEYRVCTALS